MKKYLPEIGITFAFLFVLASIFLRGIPFFALCYSVFCFCGLFLLFVGAFYIFGKLFDRNFYSDYFGYVLLFLLIILVTLGVSAAPDFWNYVPSNR